ncbi:MAG: demethylmenaquinone methyltransferase [Sciscionella sp.]|nr:demethylmenaquinone methyltransferase [Sciscionella sp.]
MSRASLDKKPREVAEMFDGVAERYDRANTVMTLGLDRHWREVTHRTLDPKPDDRVLDLAAGTAVSTAMFARSGAWCVAADFSLGMLRAGLHRDQPMVAADALRLPFADASFDALTCCFGMRNVHDVGRALREAARVVRPGGRLVICEVSTPTFAPIRFVHQRFLLKLITGMASRVSSNPQAYRYLAESTAAWPAQREFAELIAAAGWANVEWMNLMFGVVALHRATRPEEHTSSPTA